LLALVQGASGHGSLSFPRPRNSLEAAVPPWSTWSYPKDPITFSEDGKDSYGSCPVVAHNGKTMAQGGLKSNGQACFWFSNGCVIGCDKCDGDSSSCGHDDATTKKFLYKGMDAATLRRKNITVPPFSAKPGDITLDPRVAPKPVIKANCANPGKATICESDQRTMNIHAKCGSPEDIYQLSPWRAPGTAPVLDSCGAAGGRLPGQGIGHAGASYQNSSLAKLGELGSRLPPMPSQATWQAGSNVEVGWTLRAQHGGGYSYRLAPADAPLTEETFRKIHVDFVGQSFLRWDGNRSTQIAFNATRVSTGTMPVGSTWTMNPIPRAPYQWDEEGPSHEPVCEESEACKATTLSGDAFALCRCSGNPVNLEIVDVLKIPADIKPGKYVLGWRWDCEETDQVWAACSDVTVTANTATVQV